MSNPVQAGSKLNSFNNRTAREIERLSNLPFALWES